MRILGIESSSLVASTAIYEDGITMAEYTVDFKMTHSQTLLPMIDEMVKLVGIDLNTIDAIAVSGNVYPSKRLIPSQVDTQIKPLRSCKI